MANAARSHLVFTAFIRIFSGISNKRRIKKFTGVNYGQKTKEESGWQNRFTGAAGLYETPSEFVRDLIRRYMENVHTAERYEINNLLGRSIVENDYTPLTKQDVTGTRNFLDDITLKK